MLAKLYYPENLPLNSIPAPLKEKLIWFVSQIMTKPLYADKSYDAAPIDNEYPNNWVYLFAKDLQLNMGDRGDYRYTKVIEYSDMRKFVEIDNHYEIKNHPRSYRLLPPYCYAKPKLYVSNNKRYLQPMIEYDGISGYMQKCLQTITIEVPIEVKNRLNNKDYIRVQDIENGNWVYSVDDCRRQYHNISFMGNRNDDTTLNCRQYLKMDGENIAEVDLSSSHPLFQTITYGECLECPNFPLFNLPTSLEIFRNHFQSVSVEFNSILSSNSFPNTLTNSSNLSDNSIFSSSHYDMYAVEYESLIYMLSAKDFDFYTWLQAECGIPREEMERSVFKNEWYFKTIYGKICQDRVLMKKSKNVINIRNALRKHLPIFWVWLTLMKKVPRQLLKQYNEEKGFQGKNRKSGNSIFAQLIMKREADFILTCCERVKNELNIGVISNHDSLIVPAPYNNDVKRIVEDEFNKQFGITPIVKVK